MEQHQDQQHQDHQHHDHDHHHHDLRQLSGRALRLSLVILAIFFFVEVIGGILTHSLALISDAMHMLTDVAAIGLALFAQWFGKRPPSARRSYGYRRVEILAALANGVSLIVIGVLIIVEAGHRLKQPPAIMGGPLIIIAVVGLLANIAVTWALHGSHKDNLNVRGAYWHALTDALQSVGVIIVGIVIWRTGWTLIDPLASLIISLLLIFGGGRVMFEATHVLIEGTPAELDLHQLIAEIEKFPGVRQVTDIHAWSLTSGYNALSAHIEADTIGEDGTFEALRTQLTHELCHKFPLHHVTLQIEQGCRGCKISDCCGWISEGK